MAAELTYEVAFPSRFLRAADLNEKHVTVTIARAYMEILEGEKGEVNKLIVAFEKTPKEIVVCKTNGICVREMFGSKVSGWTGKRITIYPTKVPFGPKQVDAIRVYGSPDIPVPVEVSARIGRKQFKATMAKVMPGQHGFKGGEPAVPALALPDPREIAHAEALGILAWNAGERAAFFADHAGATEEQIAAVLGAEIDRMQEVR